jgi:hypothetical protein
MNALSEMAASLKTLAGVELYREILSLGRLKDALTPDGSEPLSREDRKRNSLLAFSKRLMLLEKLTGRQEILEFLSPAQVPPE